MSEPRGLWLLLPRQLRELPADLAALLVAVVATNAVVFVPVLNDSAIRVIVGLAFVLFVPGYAFIAALFPEAGRGPQPAAEEATGDAEVAADSELLSNVGAAAEAPVRDRGIDGIERVALSFGLSIAIVPLIGLALNFTPFGIRLVPIIASLSLFTAVTTAIAAIRRWELPPDERFAVPYRAWIAAGKSELFEPDSTLDGALNVLLALSILLAVGSVAYAVAVPPEGERFSEFYILGTDDDGELVADNYPETITVGEPAPIHVGIENNEYEPVTYTVIVQLQRVEGAGNESRVTQRARVEQFSVSLAHNETSIQQRDLTVSDALTGEELRLAFLLYDGDPPEQPTRENAYRDLHLWVDVIDADEEMELSAIEVA